MHLHLGGHRRLLAYVLVTIFAILVVVYVERRDIRAINRLDNNRCISINSTRKNQRIIFGEIIKILKHDSAPKFEIEKIKEAFSRLPRLDRDCNGIPDNEQRH